ncbi:MAG: hypothetical protein AABY26_02970, partial [Nanoarchaeota archaeon]
MRKIQIGIIGPEEQNIPAEKRELFLSLAYAIGKRLAENGAVVVTGGCSGIAEYSSRGAFEAGGVTVATPGPERGTSVSSTTIEICTPINVGDFVFAGTLSSDVLIVFPGDAGTIAELAIAYRYRRPLVLLKDVSEDILEGIFEVIPDYPVFVVADAEEAVNKALQIAQEK